MSKIKEALSFFVKNRRVIGVIVGSLLTLAGFPDEGEYIEKVGAL